MSASRRGLRMIRAAIALIAGFAICAGAWIAAQAARNPDVQARRPRWLEGSEAFDVAYWTPLLLTVVVGAALVVLVLVRAARRISAGEDLYARRSGRGTRRRGESRVGDG